MTDTDDEAACLRCGAVVAADALRCPNCALTFPTIAGDGDDPSWSSAPAVEGTPAAPVGGVGSSWPAAPPAAPPAPPPAPTAPPASRHRPPPPPPGTDRLPRIEPEPSGRVRRLAGAAAAVVLLGLGAGALWWSGRDTGSDTDDGATEAAGPVSVGVPTYELIDDTVAVVLVVDGVASDGLARLLVGDEVVAEAVGPGPVSLRWPDAPEGDAVVSIAVAGDGDEPISVGVAFEVPPATVGAESFGSWIMALASLPSLVRAERYAAALGDDVGPVRILSSADWASLNPGFFVPYVGPFASADEVLARCRELGRPIPDDCVGRVISTDEADRALIAR